MEVTFHYTSEPGFSGGGGSSSSAGGSGSPSSELMETGQGKGHAIGQGHMEIAMQRLSRAAKASRLHC